jgi:hypothetical protein
MVLSYSALLALTQCQLSETAITYYMAALRLVSHGSTAAIGQGNLS